MPTLDSKDDWNISKGSYVNPEMPPTFRLEVVHQTSKPGRSRSPTSTRCQAGNHVRRMKKKVIGTLKALSARIVAEYGPGKHCPHSAPLKEKRHFIGKEMTPLDLLSCDIFVI